MKRGILTYKSSWLLETSSPFEILFFRYVYITCNLMFFPLYLYVKKAEKSININKYSGLNLGYRSNMSVTMATLAKSSSKKDF